MIIKRYINKQIATTLAGVLLILMLLFITQQAIHYISYISAGKIAPHVFLPLLAFELPYLLVFLLPLALYLAMFAVYSRLYVDHEMMILQLAGFDEIQLWYATCKLVIVVSAVVLCLSLWLNPWLALGKERMVASGITEHGLIKNLSPGKFKLLADGRRVLYVEKVTNHGKVGEKLFIAARPPLDNLGQGHESRKEIIISAESVMHVFDRKLNSSFIVAEKGYRYEGVPGAHDYNIASFARYSLRPPAVVIPKINQQEFAPLAVLWSARADPVCAAELQWRISLALMPLVLSVVVVPLSRVKPRTGRYRQLISVIGIYVVYANCLMLVKHWVECGMVTSLLGMWWVHAILFLGATYSFGRFRNY